MADHGSTCIYSSPPRDMLVSGFALGPSRGSSDRYTCKTPTVQSFHLPNFWKVSARRVSHMVACSRRCRKIPLPNRRGPPLVQFLRRYSRFAKKEDQCRNSSNSCYATPIGGLSSSAVNQSIITLPIIRTLLGTRGVRGVKGSAQEFSVVCHLDRPMISSI